MPWPCDISVLSSTFPIWDTYECMCSISLHRGALYMQTLSIKFFSVNWHPNIRLFSAYRFHKMFDNRNECPRPNFQNFFNKFHWFLIIASSPQNSIKLFDIFILFLNLTAKREEDEHRIIPNFVFFPIEVKLKMLAF